VHQAGIGSLTTAKDIQHQAVWRARFALRKAAPPGLRKTGRGLTAR